MRRLRLFHFDIPTPRNYGDTLLFESVRNVFGGFAGGRAFEVYDAAPLRDPVSPRRVDYLNETADAVVIGGGGLFLSDTNPNARSGWQWNISVEQLARLQVPIILFAVGNNRFIDQPDFADPFREHLALTAERSVFFGLRNRGSVASIQEYLPPSLRDRVAYQPCPTTVADHLYPDLARPVSDERVIGVQQLVGVRQIRAGFSPEAIGRQSLDALAKLRADGWTVHGIPFAAKDQLFDDRLVAEDLRDRWTPLHGRSGRALFDGTALFPDIPVFFGTRGHAQMIPFGMGSIPVSVMVHHKLRWFAEDLQRPQWVIDPRTEDLAARLPMVINEAYEDRVAQRAHLAGVRQAMFDQTMANVAGIYRSLTGEPAPDVPFAGFAGRERESLGHAYVERLRRETLREKLTETEARLRDARPAAGSPTPSRTWSQRVRRRARRTVARLRSR